MSQSQLHDLHAFMHRMSAEIAEDYDLIQKKAAEDPGTAGDQGEENWAKLLRDWLPRSLTVRTKGRILDELGNSSPQVDVIVLRDSYPRRLLDHKYYLAAGVLAAFECKTTLKNEHFEKIFQNSKAIKSLGHPRLGTPYREMHSPIVYGLLAHSHAWSETTAHSQITEKLETADKEYINHPKHQLDLVCVPNCGSWAMHKQAIDRSHGLADLRNNRADLEKVEISWAHTGYSRGNFNYSGTGLPEPEPMGMLLSYLTRKIAWELPELRAMAIYYRAARLGGASMSRLRSWPATIFSEKLIKHVKRGARTSGLAWDEWGGVYP